MHFRVLGLSILLPGTLDTSSCRFLGGGASGLGRRVFLDRGRGVFSFGFLFGDGLLAGGCVRGSLDCSGGLYRQSDLVDLCG